MKRFVVIIAAVVMQSCLGGIYAWSAFVPELRLQFGYSSAQTQLVFGTSFLVFTLSLIITGPLLDRFGPRLLSTASGALLAAAYLMAGSKSNAFIWLWVGYGIFGGVGIGCGYLCPIATAMKWFPRHKGLVAGLAVAGYGGGAIVLANIAQWLLVREWEVSSIFRLVGLVYGPLVVFAGLFLFLPQQDNNQKIISFRRRILLKDPRFWQLFLAMFCGTLPGLMINGNLKPIGLSFGLSGHVATMGISFFAFGSAAGRVVWGFINDHLGSWRTTITALALITLSSIALVAGEKAQAAFLISALYVGFCYGSSFALYPAQVAEVYGPEVMGSVYSLVLLAHGLAAQVGPGLGGLLFDATNSFLPGMIVAGVITGAGLAGYTYLERSCSVKVLPLAVK